ncbi:hypothetical protein [Rhizobium sp. ZW T2_16]
MALSATACLMLAAPAKLAISRSSSSKR